MNYLRIFYFLLITLSFASCKKNENITIANDAVKTDTIESQDFGANQKIIRAIGETLNPDARIKVEDWKEYQQLDAFLENFYSSSPNEALNLSKELSNTTKQLGDSLKIERFKQPDVKIRINVIHNYALRLADMASIPNIKPKEVQDETQNILDAFSALNSKLNNLAKREKLEEELEGFDAPILLKKMDSITLQE